MYKTGEWVVELETGKLGYILRVENGVYLKVRFGKSIVLRHDSEVHRVPTIIYKENYHTLIDLALATNDKEWFEELNERMKTALIWGGTKVGNTSFNQR
jgi:hypothetical protein